MALMKSTNVPKDAVVLDELEAAGYIWDIVNTWESLSDTWSLRYGVVALAAVNSLSGLLINKHYRWRFKLGRYGYMASTLPIVALPGVITLMFHKHIVTTDILLMKNNNCPLCYEVKSAALQLTFGIAYPMVLAPTSALMRLLASAAQFANRYDTFRVPHLREGWRAVLGFLRRHSRPLGGTLLALAALQLAASCAVTYFELRNSVALRNKMLQLERRLEEGAPLAPDA